MYLSHVTLPIDVLNWNKLLQNKIKYAVLTRYEIEKDFQNKVLQWNKTILIEVFQLRKKFEIKISTKCQLELHYTKIRLQSKTIIETDGQKKKEKKSLQSFTLFIFQDDNFVLSAIFCAIEENNLEGLDKLLSMANIDVNQVRVHHIFSRILNPEFVFFFLRKKLSVR